MSHPKLTRRGLMLGLGAGAALAPGFAGLTAQAADVSGYRALVCVFLFGGLDNHDLVIPFDEPNHSRYVDLRRALAPDASRSRSALLELSIRNADRFGARQFALPPETPNLHRLFNDGEAAIVSSVGPLIQPIRDREQAEAGGVPLPPRLFSHNDQQSIWQANAPEGASYGWGGLFGDAVVLSGANPDARPFTTMSTAGDNLFLTGRETAAFAVGPSGPSEIELLLEAERRAGDNAELDRAYRQLRDHFGAARYDGEHLIARDIAAIHGASLDNNTAFREALTSPPSLGVDFPTGQLGGQLRIIAETIGVRAQLGVGRQVFFAGMGGFDTHSSQLEALPQLLGELDAGVAAFNQAMRNLGVNQDVTLFTGSDFGRTFAVNGDGTDHGWAGHHFVVGGGVNGGRILGGDIDPPGLDHARDVGSGRLIPQVSVEQYAAALGEWFGLNSSELASALPNLSNFDAPPALFG
ncbi:MAG: DUF1501 domain-containing protein [Oceanicaulis sp.]